MFAVTLILERALLLIQYGKKCMVCGVDRRQTKPITGTKRLVGYPVRPQLASISAQECRAAVTFV